MYLKQWSVLLLQCFGLWYIIQFGFFAFIVSLNLLIGGESYNYSTIVRSTYSLYMLQLGVFDWDDFLLKETTGPIVFITFCILVYFILLNLFIAALLEVFGQVQRDKTLKAHEVKIMRYLYRRVKIALEKAKKTRTNNCYNC